jgi:hypothetical protein
VVVNVSKVPDHAIPFNTTFFRALRCVDGQRAGYEGRTDSGEGRRKGKRRGKEMGGP